MINYFEDIDIDSLKNMYSDKSVFSNQEPELKYDNKSFSETCLVREEMTDNKNNDYSMIPDIKTIFNEKKIEMAEVSPSVFINQKERKKKKIFDIKKEIELVETNDTGEGYKYKMFNYINRWITAIIKSYMKKLNEKIKEKTSLQKLHTPSYEEFSEVFYIKKNRKKFLKKSMKDILKEKIIKKRKDSSNTKDNSYVIEQIKQINDLELLALLNMNFENVIEEFYKSFDFKMFKFNKEIITYEREFMRRNKKKNCKSLFKNNGLITLLKNKTKRNVGEQEESDDK
jgi:hypothetical protein